MAALAKQLLDQHGTAITFTAAGGSGDTVPCEAGTLLLVRNGSGAPVNVTVTTPGTDQGLAVDDLVVAVAAGATTAVGPFTDLYANASDGQAHVGYSATSSVTVACVHLPT